MTNHNHEDGVRPSLALIKERYDSGHYENDIKPTISVLLETIHQLRSAAKEQHVRAGEILNQLERASYQRDVEIASYFHLDDIAINQIDPNAKRRA